MIADEKQRAQQCLAKWLLALSQLYRVEIGGLAAETYTRILAPFPADAIDRGFLEACRRSPFPPSPSEVLAAISDTAPAAPVCKNLKLPERRTSEELSDESNT